MHYCSSNNTYFSTWKLLQIDVSPSLFLINTDNKCHSYVCKNDCSHQFCNCATTAGYTLPLHCNIYRPPCIRLWWKEIRETGQSGQHSYLQNLIRFPAGRHIFTVDIVFTHIKNTSFRYLKRNFDDIKLSKVLYPKQFLKSIVLIIASNGRQLYHVMHVLIYLNTWRIASCIHTLAIVYKVGSWPKYCLSNLINSYVKFVNCSTCSFLFYTFTVNTKSKEAVLKAKSCGKPFSIRSTLRNSTVQLGALQYETKTLQFKSSGKDARSDEKV